MHVAVLANHRDALIGRHDCDGPEVVEPASRLSHCQVHQDVVGVSVRFDPGRAIDSVDAKAKHL